MGCIYNMEPMDIDDGVSEEEEVERTPIALQPEDYAHLLLSPRRPHLKKKDGPPLTPTQPTNEQKDNPISPNLQNQHEKEEKSNHVNEEEEEKIPRIFISWLNENNTDLSPLFQKGGFMTKLWRPEEPVLTLTDEVMTTFGYYMDLAREDVKIWWDDGSKYITTETWQDIG